VAKLLEEWRRRGALEFERSAGPVELDVKVHREPVWRERADHIIHGRVEHEGAREIREQLWGKKLADDRYELCCIPFFIYDLALGDEVETGAGKDFGVIERVVKRSGRRTYWVWLAEDSDAPTRRRVAAKLNDGCGCLTEWYSKQLLAVDVVSDEQADAILSALKEEIDAGLLECVPGQSG
jgi:hypothetical protein